MAATYKFHLVDNAGKPLEPHVVNAVQDLMPRIQREFSSVCDISDISNCVEAAARHAAEDEKRIGGAKNITQFVWARIANSLTSLIRSQSRLEFAGEIELALKAGEARDGGEGAILAEIEGKKLLSWMTLRDRRICKLEYQGYGTKEIAQELGMTEAAVWKAKSRRRETLKSYSALPR